MKPSTVVHETIKNAILVASYGTFSTGINVRRLHHIVLASPTKSRYRVLQSIGRGLRLHPSKRIIYVHDIVDDARVKTYTNSTYIHWQHRLAFYHEEQFPVDVYEHTMKGLK